MRTTKTFSFNNNDLKWIRRMERDAKQNHRPFSKQIIHILKYYFDHKKLLNKINCNLNSVPSMEGIPFARENSPGDSAPGTLRDIIRS